MTESLTRSGAEPFAHHPAPPSTDHGGARFRRPIGRNPHQSRTTHRFRPSTCPRCRAITLHGIDANGFATHLDPTPLDTRTELVALSRQQRTYQLDRNHEAIHRSAIRITAHPAGNHAHYAAFAQHACQQPPIPPTIVDWAWTPTPRPVSEEPGF